MRYLGIVSQSSTFSKLRLFKSACCFTDGGLWGNCEADRSFLWGHSKPDGNNLKDSVHIILLDSDTILFPDIFNIFVCFFLSFLDCAFTRACSKMTNSSKRLQIHRTRASQTTTPMHESISCMRPGPAVNRLCANLLHSHTDASRPANPKNTPTVLFSVTFKDEPKVLVSLFF